MHSIPVAFPWARTHAMSHVFSLQEAEHSERRHDPASGTTRTRRKSINSNNSRLAISTSHKRAQSQKTLRGLDRECLSCSLVDSSRVVPSWFGFLSCCAGLCFSSPELRRIALHRSIAAMVSVSRVPSSALCSF